MDNQFEENQGFINLNDLLNGIPDCFLHEITSQEKGTLKSPQYFLAKDELR